MLQDLISGFDQETAAVVMARLVSFKMEIEVITVPNIMYFRFKLNLHGRNCTSLKPIFFTHTTHAYVIMHVFLHSGEQAFHSLVP